MTDYTPTVLMPKIRFKKDPTRSDSYRAWDGDDFVGDVYPCPVNTALRPVCDCGKWHGLVFSAQYEGAEYNVTGYTTRADAARAMHAVRLAWALPHSKR